MTTVNKSGRHKVDELNRECYCCGSRTTYIDKTGRRQWVLNPDIATRRLIGVLCRYCYSRLIWNKSAWMCDYKSKRMRFMGPTITVSRPPRKGICQLCGWRGATHVHHEKYDESDPLAFTIEVCPRCHIRLGMDLGQIVPGRKKVQGTKASASA